MKLLLAEDETKLARVRAMLRRREPMEYRQKRLGNLFLDDASYSIRTSSK